MIKNWNNDHIKLKLLYLNIFIQKKKEEEYEEEEEEEQNKKNSEENPESGSKRSESGSYLQCLLTVQIWMCQYLLGASVPTIFLWGLL